MTTRPSLVFGHLVPELVRKSSEWSVWSMVTTGVLTRPSAMMRATVSGCCLDVPVGRRWADEDEEEEEAERAPPPTPNTCPDLWAVGWAMAAVVQPEEEEAEKAPPPTPNTCPDLWAVGWAMAAVVRPGGARDTNRSICARADRRRGKAGRRQSRVDDDQGTREGQGHGGRVVGHKRRGGASEQTLWA